MCYHTPLENAEAMKQKKEGRWKELALPADSESRSVKHFQGGT
jgi:hypothetical protein